MRTRIPHLVQDHPRIRGEHTLSTAAMLFSPGSSPHTRGARAHRGAAVPANGIIPAYAGSTIRRCASSPNRPDHPRIRGEHDHALLFARRRRGSSPHTRGARQDKPPPVVGGRIIPAYAGSTLMVLTFLTSRRDHPRIRGEHEMGAVGSIFPSGSSPHTRGAPGRGSGTTRRRRIIPAYAGSTLLCAGQVGVLEDHPRIRGEHEYPILGLKAEQGSSPHTRGARARALR